MTSLCTFQLRQRYVSNETPNEVLVERCQDVQVVRLPDDLLERRDDVLTRPKNNVPSLRLCDVSNRYQIKYSTTSQWYVSVTSHYYISTTSSVSQNKAPKNFAVVRLQHVLKLCCCNGLYVFKLLCQELNLVCFHVSFKYQIKLQIFSTNQEGKYKSSLD